jgi:hypothetical protein
MIGLFKSASLMIFFGKCAQAAISELEKISQEESLQYCKLSR